MLFSHIIFASALLAVGLAQEFSRNLPKCVENCVIETIRGSNCVPTDLKACFCTNVGLQTKQQTCINHACNATEIAYSESEFRRVCNRIPQDTRAKWVFLSLIFLLSITAPVVALRFLSRWFVAKKIWWDDWLILISTLLLFPTTLYPITCAGLYSALHLWDIPPEKLQRLLRSLYISQVLYNIVITTTKISILFLYLRIFTGAGFRRAVKMYIWILFFHGTASVFTSTFQCIPLRSWWTNEPAKCINLPVYGLVSSGLIIIEDLIIILFPVWELRKLKIDTKRVFALIILFAMGLFATTTTAFRLHFIVNLTHSSDKLWETINIVLWANIEQLLGIICACLICIPTLLKNIFNYLEIGRVKTFGETTKIGTNNSQRWFHSKAHDGSEELSRSSKASAAETLINSREEEGIWIRNSTLINGNSLDLDDMNASKDQFTTYYKHQVRVEANPL